MMTKKKTQNEKRPLLFEIGVEELPSSYIQTTGISEQEGFHKATFEEAFEKAFGELRLEFDELKVFVTPRRIVFHARVAGRQEAVQQEVRGPSKDRSFDASGKPTKALQGFLKSKGLTLPDIKFKESGKGNYAVGYIKHKAQPTEKMLPEILRNLVGFLSFPKYMRWENQEGSFPRPIRWLVAFFGTKPVPVRYGDLRANRFSRGHRFLCPKKVPVTGSDLKKYQTALKKAYVLLDQIVPQNSKKDRLETIRKQIQTKIKGTQIDFNKLDDELIQTISNLVEYPHVFIGNFKKDYLKLPKEVLSASMKKHQKILACYTKAGKILNHFVAVTNGSRGTAAMKAVKKNFENVLDAKLRDAQFFYNEDTKTSLESKVDTLKGVVFLGKLGSVYDKTQRLVAFAQHFGRLPELGLTEKESEALEKAAKLCKADLTTQMVYEFPELQGIMGSQYALHDRAGQQVADGIFEHYLPRFRDDILPKSKIGAFLAIFDKIDTFCGAFAIGLVPTGSQDPYALRRASIGIARILKEHELPLSLQSLFDFGLDQYEQVVAFDRPEVYRELIAFMKDKVSFVFEDKLKNEQQKALLKSAMATSFDDLASLEKRLASLIAMQQKKKDTLEKSVKICERTFNILKNNQDSLGQDINVDLLEPGIEKDLYNAFVAAAPEIGACYESNDYSGMAELYVERFYDLVNHYFDQVMINVEDPTVRSNRKKLMLLINQLLTKQLADLSLLKV